MESEESDTVIWPVKWSSRYSCKRRPLLGYIGDLLFRLTLHCLLCGPFRLPLAYTLYVFVVQLSTGVAKSKHMASDESDRFVWQDAAGEGRVRTRLKSILQEDNCIVSQADIRSWWPSLPVLQQAK